MSDIWKTRATLLKRAQDKNDEQAWEDFVEFYTPYIEIVLKKMRLHEEAEDIHQEILLKIWKYLQTFDGEKHNVQFRTWLSRLIRNTAITFIQNKFRRSSVNQHMSEGIIDKLVSEDDLSNIIDQEWQLYITKTALIKVKPYFSDNAMLVFELSLKNKTTKEISERLNLTEASVRTLKNRVKNRMTEEVKLLREQQEIS